MANVCERELPRNDVVAALKRDVHEFKPSVPVVRALRNPALLDTHWRLVREVLGRTAEWDENYPHSVTLGWLVKLGALQRPHPHPRTPMSPNLMPNNSSRS